MSFIVYILQIKCPPRPNLFCLGHGCIIMFCIETIGFGYQLCCLCLQGRPVNVKHDARCVMGKVGEDKNPKRGEILIYCYKFAVIG